MTEFHAPRAFAREEPRVELIDRLLGSLLKAVQLEFEGRPVEVDGFRLRDPEQWRTARETSLQQNLGSLSTVCNCSCTFCYEDGNPEDLFVRQPRFVSLAEAKTRRLHLHDGRGMFRESKGFFEPLTNPDLLSILRLVREADPGTIIDMTTNGAALTQEMIASLAELHPVMINVSGISADPAVRKALVHDHRSTTAIEAVALLQQAQVPFMGTVVPMPEQGLDDLETTIRFYEAHEARVIRVSVPAFSGVHPRYEAGAMEEWRPLLFERVELLRERLETPILVSPFAHLSTNIMPTIEGVIRRSPAAQSGLRLGDRLVTIDGKMVVSRAHAESLLRQGAERGAIDVTLARGSEALETRLEEPSFEVDAYPYKPSGYQPLHVPGLHFGICMPGSFHLQYLRQIHDLVVERAVRRALVVASAFYRDLVADLVGQLPLPVGSEVELVTPENRFFGGDVTVGDLWVLDDIEAAARPYFRADQPPDLLILPDSFLSHWGRDLRGVPYTELEERLGIDIALVSCERIML